MSGIISVMIMSSFMIYRIILDRNINESNLEAYEKVSRAENAVARLYIMIEESKRRTSAWVYQQTDSENKAALMDITNTMFPSLKFNFEMIFSDGSGVDKDQVKKILIDFDTLVARQQLKIVSRLQTKDDYEDQHNASRAQASLKSEILPLADSLLSAVEVLGEDMEEESERIRVNAAGRRFRGHVVLGILASLMFLAGIIGMMIVLSSPAWKNRSAT
jgi:hypothetical protein